MEKAGRYKAGEDRGSKTGRQAGSYVKVRDEAMKMNRERERRKGKVQACSTHAAWQAGTAAKERDSKTGRQEGYKALQIARHACCMRRCRVENV